MADTEEEVSLSQAGERYTLRRKDLTGKKTRIVLTATNLLAILPIIQRECTQRLEQWAGSVLRLPGVSPIVPMAATGYDVTVDEFHKDEVFLTLRDGYGNHFAFALSPTDAVMIAKRLAEKFRELKPPPPQTRRH
jgi:hypothetical protein